MTLRAMNNGYRLESMQSYGTVHLRSSLNQVRGMRSRLTRFSRAEGGPELGTRPRSRLTRFSRAEGGPELGTRPVGDRARRPSNAAMAALVIGLHDQCRADVVRCKSTQVFTIDSLRKLVPRLADGNWPWRDHLPEFRPKNRLNVTDQTLCGELA